jgi:hypothetical protein
VLFYVTSALFVVVALGSVMLYMRLNIFHMLRYLREEGIAPQDLHIAAALLTAAPPVPLRDRTSRGSGV